MHVSFFIKGLLAGLAIAAPVGPTTVLVVHRVIKQSLKDGLASGVGAAVADSLYALLAGVGAGFVAGYIEPHFLLIRLAGGAFLFYWGRRIFLSKFAESHPLVKDKGFGGPLVSTFILTLTNPVTLLAFAAVLVGLRASGLQNNPAQLMEWMAGICLGSLSWWLFVSVAVYFFRSRFDFKALTWLNRAMGVIIILAGFGVFLDLVKLLFIN